MLTQEQKTILQNEITNDPLGKGYANYLPDAPGKVVELLNELTRTRLWITEPNALLVFLMQEFHVGTGIRLYWYLKKIRDNTELTEDIRFFALQAVELADARLPIDLSIPQTVAELDLMVQLGLLSEDQKAKFLALGVHNISRASELGFTTSISEIDVVETLIA